MTSRAEGIQIEERSMILEICIAINNEEGAAAPSYAARLSQLHRGTTTRDARCDLVEIQIPWVFGICLSVYQSCLSI